MSKTRTKKQAVSAEVRRTVAMIEYSLLMGAWRDRRTGEFLPPMPPLAVIEEKESSHAVVRATSRRTREEAGSRREVTRFEEREFDRPCLFDGVLMRVRSLSPGEMRRANALLSSLTSLPVAVALDCYNLDRDNEEGTYDLVRTFYGWHQGFLFPCAGYGAVIGCLRHVNAARDVEELLFAGEDVDIAMCYWRILDRCWSVSLTCEGTPGIRLLTDPTGVLALLADREGERHPSGRRKALLHWVSAHYRAKRNNPGDLIRIRDYLRGARTFRWHGLDGTIHPPE